MSCSCPRVCTAHSLINTRLNERVTLSLAEFSRCLILDDELDVLPITSSATKTQAQHKHDQGAGDRATQRMPEEHDTQLPALQGKLKAMAIGRIVAQCVTFDQAKYVMVLLESAA